jgi:hypothetical protein
MSQAQAAANAANSRLSTGPKSEQGKRASSANSIRHGLTAKQVVLPGEDATDYEDLRASLLADWNPANTQEAILTDQIAQHAWRLQRARRVETRSLQLFCPSMEPTPVLPGEIHLRVPADHDEAVMLGFHDYAADLDKLRRYEAAIERSYYKAIGQLQKLQIDRRKQEQQEAKAAVPAKALTATNGFVSQNPEQSQPTIGFVSQSTPAPVEIPTFFIAHEPEILESLSSACAAIVL